MGESVAYGFAATDGRLNDSARRAGLLLSTDIQNCTTSDTEK
jgi:hypothetical protein